MERVVGLANRLQQICTQLGDTAGNSILVDKLSSIVVVGGQVGSLRLVALCCSIMGGQKLLFTYLYKGICCLRLAFCSRGPLCMGVLAAPWMLTKLLFSAT